MVEKMMIGPDRGDEMTETIRSKQSADRVAFDDEAA
jgi:hypothetical protein